MIDSTIVRLLIKENFNETFKILEEKGGSLYFNNTINKWLLSIFAQGISDMYNNFIWDLFLLEGNIIIFKAIYAIFFIIEKYIKNYKTFDDLNQAFNVIPLTFNNRGKLAYYLIGKQFNFNMEIIKKYRKSLSSQIIREIMALGSFNDYEEKDDDEKDNDDNKNICDLDWPQCIKDKKNLEKEYDFIILKQLENPNVINDYVDCYKVYKNGMKNFVSNNKKFNFINDDDIESKRTKYFKEERFKDLLIERKKHYCISKKMSIRSYKDNQDTNNIKKFQNYFKKSESLIERDRRIDRIVTQISKGNHKKIAFKKEDKEFLFDDDKK